MDTTTTARRVIRGRKALRAVTGLGYTAQVDLEERDPTFAKPFKPGGERGRGLAWFEDEVVAWQQQRAEARDAAAQAKVERQTGDGEPRKFRRRRPRSSIHVRGRR
jgi:predicted DNA-binding transcriptional regulator AlpA